MENMTFDWKIDKSAQKTMSQECAVNYKKMYVAWDTDSERSG